MIVPSPFAFAAATFALASGLLVAVTGAADAHHSIAMFDQAHPVVLVGTVREYRFTSPHSIIMLEVKGNNDHPVIWSLEGQSPNSLTWDGWSNKTLHAGDEIRITVEPLRSGASGGTWDPKKTTFKDGTSIVAVH